MSLDHAAALRACREESERAYRSAKAIVWALKGETEKIAAGVEETVAAIRRLSPTDGEMRRACGELEKKLTALKRKFQDEISKIGADIETKHANDRDFNITLFGKTTVGKSTLMAILTHGNTGAIGKGGQRTTRDVREYEWEGMKITDVPGINAFEGQEDTALAEKAAKTADLIVFLISSGQPESIEADWLIRLKKEDKPIICLCNFRQSLESEEARRFALRRMDRTVAKMGLEELRAQFNEFVKTELPGEEIEIFVVGLLAQLLAQDASIPAEERPLLRQMSQFEAFSEALLRQTAKYGAFYRFRSYMALIDVPIYQQYQEISDIVSITWSTLQSIREKRAQFEKWREAFNRSEPLRLRKEIHEVFAGARATVYGFVAENVERSDRSGIWKKHLENLKLDEKIRMAFEDSVDGCAKKKVSDFFATLATDMEFSCAFTGRNLGEDSIINWRKYWGWGSALIGGALAFIAAPIGLVIGAALSFIGSLFDSREEKLRAAKEKLQGNLLADLEKKENAVWPRIEKRWREVVIGTIQRDAATRFQLLEEVVSRVFLAEREALAEFREQHLKIADDLVKNALGRYGIHPRYTLGARIPGKKCLFITADPNMFAPLKEWFGKGEAMRMLASRGDSQSEVERGRQLADSFLKNIPWRAEEFEDKYLIFVPKAAYSPEELENFNLLQQFLGVPVIQSNIGGSL